MRSSILFFLIPVAALEEVHTAGSAATGQLCCNSGVPDPSGTCTKMQLNSYACESFRGNVEKAHRGDPGRKNGCDNEILSGLFPIGREVKAFVKGSTNTIPLKTPRGDTVLAFIGCAK
ncbi:hypothetical protein PspLS_11568 [Pyricularia sp. CBS 133598]|nr:hypothetical protein PspLS_11568 [Pyricularia sp. CBS 133598]